MALEGCMASSISQARQGTLYLMCAGERRCFERVRPILERLSTALRFVGRAARSHDVGKVAAKFVGGELQLRVRHAQCDAGLPARDHVEVLRVVVARGIALEWPACSSHPGS